MEQAPLKKMTKKTHVLVVGLGKSGLSAVKFCQQQGAQVSVSDSTLNCDDHNVARLKKQGVFCELGGHSVELFMSVDLILISPGVPIDLPVLAKARKKGIPVVGELALAPLYLKTPVVAVTGTNGKTTVTSLLGDLFNASGRKIFVGGNIGTPLTDYLAGDQDADCVILEVSSFQLDAAGTFRPEIGMLLNVSPDHLDRYPSYDKYILSKMSLFFEQNNDDIAILNCNDADTMKFIHGPSSICDRRKEVGCLYFGRSLDGKPGAEIEDTKVQLSATIWQSSEEEYDLAGTGLASSPNLENGAAAILAARVAGCPAEGIRKGLQEFNTLPHRMALVGEIDGVKYLNDSKATNIGAVRSALAALKSPVVLIAGGRDKGGEYGILADIVRKRVKAMLLIGEAREKMAGVFQSLTKVELMESLPQAVSRAKEVACPGDVVLLSPACASFDMFSSYSQRGDDFQNLVSALS